GHVVATSSASRHLPLRSIHDRLQTAASLPQGYVRPAVPRAANSHSASVGNRRPRNRQYASAAAAVMQFMGWSSAPRKLLHLGVQASIYAFKSNGPSSSGPASLVAVAAAMSCLMSVSLSAGSTTAFAGGHVVHMRYCATVISVG